MCLQLCGEYFSSFLFSPSCCTSAPGDSDAFWECVCSWEPRPSLQGGRADYHFHSVCIVGALELTAALELPLLDWSCQSYSAHVCVIPTTLLLLLPAQMDTDLYSKYMHTYKHTVNHTHTCTNSCILANIQSSKNLCYLVLNSSFLSIEGRHNSTSLCEIFTSINSFKTSYAAGTKFAYPIIYCTATIPDPVHLFKVPVLFSPP